VARDHHGHKRRTGIVKARWTVVTGLILLLVAVSFVVTWASDAQMYFSADRNGETRVTKIREGDEIWIVVYDPDEDIDCDVRDKVWTDVKVMDTKTGAHLVWKSYFDQNGDANGDLFGHPDYVPYKGRWPGTTAGWLGADFLEETSHSTGVFVSSRPFQFGTRVAYGSDGRRHGHIVGPYTGAGPNVVPTDFEWGNYLYAEADGNGHGDDRVWVNRAQGFELAQGANILPTDVAYLPPGVAGANARDYMLGRFENMDTVTGLYVDQNDPGDVALARGKINDTEATLEWSRGVYRDANEAATIIVVDPDENLSCAAVETVPVFILVNPGSWNPQTPTSSNDFCSLKRYGGVISAPGAYGVADSVVVKNQAIVWHNIYRSYDAGNGNDAWVDLAADGSSQPNQTGTYYVDYPTANDNNVVAFDTASNTGVTRVMFYATETSADSGVFELWLNSILGDLGFRSLAVRDVLAAYYIDPNDQDDFKLATAYIERKSHSEIRFTDASRASESVFWLGRDPVYIELIDSNANQDACCPEKVLVQVCDPHEVDDVEWLVLDEMSSNSPVFFTRYGMELVSVWDAFGLGDPTAHGGFSLQLDNWDLEAFNEDSIFARYNDVIYQGAHMALLGDQSTLLGFPPTIASVRVGNDVSFSVFEVGDTQVYDGDQMTMHFLDRQGNRVDGYFNSDCVFIEVIDPDQDEDQRRRERIDGYWDGGQNVPFGPQALNGFSCQFDDRYINTVNDLLGDTDIHNASPGTSLAGLGYRIPDGPDDVVADAGWAKLYVLNPRNGRWTAVDLLETGIDTGDFVSVTCIDLVSTSTCVPSLAVLPGDTILAVYQDPSNHSDVAWVSIKVGIGGALPTGSTLSFVDAVGDAVAAYVEGDPIYVMVVDPSVADAGTLADAVTIDGATYDLTPLPGAAPGTFITAALDLGFSAGEAVTATYVDPSDPTDTSTASISIVATEFRVERFYTAPSPFVDETRFGFVGTGMADTFAVTIHDLAGRLVWCTEEEDVLSVGWDGRNEDGEQLANGAYVYVVVASGSESTFTTKGKVFIQR
jgi:hypothetical protein